MRNLLIPVLSLLLLPGSALAWGTRGHHWIAQKALDALRGEVRARLEPHRAWLIEHSMDPDYRKKDDPEEFYRHFIDFENYGLFPFPGFDLDRRRLEGHLGRSTVRQNGTVLWAARDTYRRLVEAFRARDQKAILRQAADLCHYVGDLHQPLHATTNYDGQLSGQKGIHARFESELVDRFIDRIPFIPAPPHDLGPLPEVFYQIALESYQWADNVLVADWQTVRALKIDRAAFAWSKEDPKVFPDPYFREMYRRLGPLLEDRLNRAANRLASLWTMAWRESRTKP